MRAVIFAGGEIPDREAARRALQPEDWIVAADGGSRHCRALGITPSVLIGDLDSADPAQVSAWRQAGIEVIPYPPEKNMTDLELALWLALDRGAGEILVLGAMGGRWDHSLANVMLTAHPALRRIPLTLSDGRQQARLLHGEGRWQGNPGDMVSLIPIGGDAAGVTTAGLRYPLQDGTLDFGSSRGLSNVLTGSEASVSVRRGMLLAFFIPGGQPGGAA